MVEFVWVFAKMAQNITTGVHNLYSDQYLYISAYSAMAPMVLSTYLATSATSLIQNTTSTPSVRSEMSNRRHSVTRPLTSWGKNHHGW